MRRTAVIDQKSCFRDAQSALEDLARATGMAYSWEPKLGALSLFTDHRANVYAMLVTNLDRTGEDESEKYNQQDGHVDVPSACRNATLGMCARRASRDQRTPSR